VKLIEFGCRHNSIHIFTNQLRRNLQNNTLLSNLRRGIVTVLEDFIRLINAYPPRIQQVFLDMKVTLPGNMLRTVF